MNTIHAHLVLVHIPIVLTPLAAVMLLASYIKRFENMRSVAAALLIICGVTASLASLTGDEASERLEHVAGVSEETIEHHEEMGEVATWVCAIAGIASLITLFPATMGMRRQLTAVLFILSWFSSGVLGYTGYLGGMIRHPEAYSYSTQGDEHDDDD